MAASSSGAKIDRRVSRTRRTLQHALLSLMLKQGYDAVTVEDICAEADVGRSTFYAHFTGKDDLKRSALDEHLRKVLVERASQARVDGRKDERLGFAIVFFRHAKDHLDLYRALVSKGGAQTTLAMIRQIATDEVRRELAESTGRKGQDEAPREAAVQFMVGALMSLLTWWLDSGAKLPPERVDALFRRWATKGVAAL